MRTSRGGAPVDPDRTLFRVASVSKLFTATAALQLVESGALALDDDVNLRLRTFRVPDAFGEPVRVRHLLTHTGGFDDRLIGMSASTEAGREPLLAHLARRLPRRVAPPGRVFSYSNYGMGLVGAVVEETAGVPFDDVRRGSRAAPARHAPLELRARPGAPRRPRDRLRGRERRARSRWRTTSNDLEPAGGLAATGADMGRFVAAVLAGGAGPHGRVLAPATVADMLTPHFTHDPTLPGVGWGFLERRHGDLVTWEHSGDLGGFASLLLPDPVGGRGLLPLLQRRRPPAARTLRAGVPRPLLPEAGARARPRRRPRAAPARVAAAAGWYRWNRTTREDLSKPLAFPLRVEARGADTIRLVVPGGIVDPIELREFAPGKFARDDGDERAVLGTGADGRVETLFLAAFGLPFAFDRLARPQSPPFQLGALAAGAALALSAAVGWPIAAWRRRRRGAPAPTPLARMATAFGLAASLAWLGLLVGLASSSRASPRLPPTGAPARASGGALVRRGRDARDLPVRGVRLPGRREGVVVARVPGPLRGRRRGRRRRSWPSSTTGTWWAFTTESA